MQDSDILDAIDDGDTHDQPLLHNREEESIEETIRRLVESIPSPMDHECMSCGRDITKCSDLANTNWIAWRQPVEDTTMRRTDMYCSVSCLDSAIRGALGRYEDQRKEAANE